jgi:hypothetical protein
MGTRQIDKPNKPNYLAQVVGFFVAHVYLLLSSLFSIILEGKKANRSHQKPRLLFLGNLRHEKQAQ